MTMRHNFEANAHYIANKKDYFYICYTIFTAMLHSFTVDNFRSFGEKTTFSMEVQNAIRDLGDNGFYTCGNSKILNVAVIYGANSSGKSNLLEAMQTMRHIVLHSVRLNDDEELPYRPYLYTSKESQPTLFEIKFNIGNDIFYYAIWYDSQSIIKEFLRAKFPRRSEKTLFIREGQGITHLEQKYFSEASEIKSSLENSDSRIKLNKNRLLISLAGQLGGEVSNKIINWFRKEMRVISGINDTQYSDITKNMLQKDDTLKEPIVSFLKDMHLGFNSIKTSIIKLDDIAFPPGLPKEIIEQYKKVRGDEMVRVSTIHNVYDDSGKEVGQIECDLEETESAGTKKVFNLAGPIVEVLNRGGTICIDEFDSKLHPLLSRNIIKLFNDIITNGNSAQLIVTSHDTSFMMSKVLRRDQICFIKKTNIETSMIERLSDMKLQLGDSTHAPRPDSNYEKNYLSGIYGAVPEFE